MYYLNFLLQFLTVAALNGDDATIDARVKQLGATLKHVAVILVNGNVHADQLFYEPNWSNALEGKLKNIRTIGKGHLKAQSMAMKKARDEIQPEQDLQTLLQDNYDKLDAITKLVIGNMTRFFMAGPVIGLKLHPFQSDINQYDFNRDENVLENACECSKDMYNIKQIGTAFQEKVKEVVPAVIAKIPHWFQYLITSVESTVMNAVGKAVEHFCYERTDDISSDEKLLAVLNIFYSEFEEKMIVERYRITSRIRAVRII